MQLDKNDISLHFLDSIVIILDQEDNLDDDVIGTNFNSHVSDNQYETIDMDHDFPNIISKWLTLTPSIKHIDSLQSPCMDLDIFSIMLDVVPLASFPPFPNVID